jgi:hypothetical protein
VIANLKLANVRTDCCDNACEVGTKHLPAGPAHAEDEAADEPEACREPRAPDAAVRGGHRRRMDPHQKRATFNGRLRGVAGRNSLGAAIAMAKCSAHG